MIYQYYCPKCETIIEQQEPMADHSYKNPGPKCETCDIETLHKISGSPMVKLMWND